MADRRTVRPARGAMKAVRRLLPAGATLVARRVRQAWLLRRTPAVPVGPIPELASPAIADVFAVDREADWRAARAEVDALFPFVGLPEAVSPDERRVLWHLVGHLKPQSVLEVGTSVGGSTLWLAMALREGPPGSRLVTLDAVDVNDPDVRRWERDGLSASPREMVERLGCGEFVEFVTARALDYLAGRREAFDFIFLDGDHGARNMYREIALALRALRPGGCILLHDYFPNLRQPWPGAVVAPGVWLAAERLRRETPRLAVRPVEVAPGGRVSCLGMLARV